MWSNVLERGQSSFTITLSKSQWHDANLVRHTNSDVKCPNRQQERLTLCLKSLYQSLECWLGASLCQKHWAKTIPSKLVIFKLAQLNRKETWTAGRCPWVSFLITQKSLWHRDRTQIASYWTREATPEFIKDCLEQCKVVSRSFYVSFGVARTNTRTVSRIITGVIQRFFDLTRLASKNMFRVSEGTIEEYDHKGLPKIAHVYQPIGSA